MKTHITSKLGINFYDQKVAFIIAALLLAVFYPIALSLRPGWGTWLLTAPAFCIIMITAMARLRDIQHMGKRWQLRRLGLIFVGSGALVFCIDPFVGRLEMFPSWKTTLLSWGFALSWLTTPNMPPWWRYISGEYKSTYRGVETNESNKPR